MIDTEVELQTGGVLFHNCHGISSSKINNSPEYLNERNAYVINIQDTQMDLSDGSAMSKNFQSSWGGGSMKTVHSPNSLATKLNSGKHRIGGCATLIRSGMTQRIRKLYHDTRGWGRYSGVRLTGKQNRMVLILNVYVPIKSDEKGSMWATQQSLLPDCTPPEQLYDDITPILLKALTKDWVVILGGDFNAAWKPGLPSAPLKSRQLFQFITTTQLTNLWATMRPTLPYFLTYRKNGCLDPGAELISSTDHIFVSDNFTKITKLDVQMETDDVPVPPFESDHVPLFLKLDLLKLLNISPDDVSIPVTNLRTSINFRDKDKKSEYQETVEHHFDKSNIHKFIKDTCSDPSRVTTEQLAHATKLISKAYSKTYNKMTFPISNRSKNFRMGYSPAYIHLKTQLRAIQSVIRLFTKGAKPSKLRSACEHYNHLKDPDFPHLNVSRALSDDEAWGQYRLQLANIAGKIRKKCHGRERQKMREDISKAIKYRESLRKTRKVKKYIDLVIKRSRHMKISHFNDNGPDTEPNVISGKNMLKVLPSKMDSYFTPLHEPWYKGHAINENSEEGRKLRINIANGDLSQIQDINDTPGGHYRKLLQLLRRKSSTVTGRPLTPEDFGSEGFMQKISLKDLKLYLGSKKLRSAPGLNGVSFTMLKNSSDVVLNTILLLVNAVISSGNFPPLWKLRSMTLLPKKPGLLHYTEFRPIVLLDTLRKLTLGILQKRLTKVWLKHGLMDPNQYAFLPHKNTSQPLLNLMCMAEDAKQFKKPLYVVSQDIRKAYDTVPTHMGKEMALRRLGCPEHYISLFLEADLGNFITLNTAHGMTAEFTYKSSMPNSSTEGWFSADRGIGQGADESPAEWDAFYDLYSSFHEKYGIDPYVLEPVLTPAASICTSAFADDSNNPSSSSRGRDNALGLSHAFFQFHGMDIAWNKTECAHINTVDGMSETPLKVNLDQYSLSPFTCKIKNIPASKSMKYLGLFFNLNNKWTELQDTLIHKISKSAGLLSSARTSSDGAWYIIQQVLMRQIEYITQFAPMSSTALKKLDGIIRATLKSKMRLPSSFPTDLLLADNSCGGIGHFGVIDSAMSARLQLVLNTITSPITPTTSKALLNRIEQLQLYAQNTGSIWDSTSPELHVNVSPFLEQLLNWMKKHHLHLKGMPYLPAPTDNHLWIPHTKPPSNSSIPSILQYGQYSCDLPQRSKRYPPPLKNHDGKELLV